MCVRRFLGWVCDMDSLNALIVIANFVIVQALPMAVNSPQRAGRDYGLQRVALFKFCPWWLMSFGAMICVADLVAAAQNINIGVLPRLLRSLLRYS